MGRVLHRVTARFWVDSYLTRLRLVNIPAFVVVHGDDTAGTVLVKLNTLDGQAKLFHRSYNLMDDERLWSVMDAGPEALVDDQISRERQRDPDLWVIEVEDQRGRHLLDQPGLT